MELRGRSVYSGWPDRHKCVFVHVPKAAGTSVARALFGVDSRHVPALEYERANPRKFKRYFKFAFTRNPWSRVHSAYWYLKGGGMNDADREFAERHLSSFINFESFVLEGLRADEIAHWVHFRPQLDFIVDSSGEVAMDFIGRVENLERDFRNVCDLLDIQADLPKLNVSSTRCYRDDYTDEMIERVYAVYRRDIEVLGYQRWGVK